MELAAAIIIPNYPDEADRSDRKIVDRDRPKETNILNWFVNPTYLEVGNLLNVKTWSLVNVISSTSSQDVIFGIPVIIEYDEDGTIIITDDKINMYGVGDTITEAIKDYKSVVLSYFDDLKLNEKKLGQPLKTHLNYLKDRLKDMVLWDLVGNDR